LLETDKIIPAIPLAPNLELMDKIKGKVAEIYVVGDCASPGIIPDATASGWESGIKYKIEPGYKKLLQNLKRIHHMFKDEFCFVCFFRAGVCADAP